MKIEEVSKIVATINQDIYESSGIEEPLVIVESDGVEILVRFNDKCIWNTIDDIREYVDEDEDVKESLEIFLRREINYMLKLQSKIKLKKY